MPAPAKSRPLGRGERVLYHQVHPLKLATDILTAAGSLLLLFRRSVVPALFVMFGPSIVVSVLLVEFADFSKVAQSPVGDFLRRYMTKTMQAVRLAGMGVAAVGAWQHRGWLGGLGAAIVVWGWVGGWLLARARRATTR